MKLPLSFYLHSDVVYLARQFLGKYLYTAIDGIMHCGIITETEAYAGIIDQASHAYGGRYTARTKVMFSKGGIAYVYLCYGIHSLFNIVTSTENNPHAVLVRGVLMFDNKDYVDYKRTNGPGKLSKMMGIDCTMNGESLQGNRIWVEDKGVVLSDNEILVSKRIGIDYAGEDANLPYRFNVLPEVIKQKKLP